MEKLGLSVVAGAEVAADAGLGLEGDRRSFLNKLPTATQSLVVPQTKLADKHITNITLDKVLSRSQLAEFCEAVFS